MATEFLEITEENKNEIFIMRQGYAVCPQHGKTLHKQLNSLPITCCQCSEIREEQERKKQEEEKKQQEIENYHRHLRNNGINPLGKGLDDWQFDDTQLERQKKIIASLERYANNFNNNLPNLLLIGGTGSGKTMLVNAVAKTVNDKQAKKPITWVNGNAVNATFAERNPAHLISSSDITNKARATWTDKHQTEDGFIKNLSIHPLLIIDDLGDGDTSHNADMAAADRNRISQIISKRYQKHPTIITTNMTQDAVTEFLGDRAWDRLQENLVIIKCDWDSYRQSHAKVAYL